VQPATAGRSVETLVTITGANLGTGSNVVAVLLAGLPTIIVSQSPTQIVVRTIVTSAQPTSATVDIRTAAGSIVQREAAFTFLAGANHRKPVLHALCGKMTHGSLGVSIDRITPNNGPIDGNNTVTITGIMGMFTVTWWLTSSHHGVACRCRHHSGPLWWCGRRHFVPGAPVHDLMDHQTVLTASPRHRAK
jgi:hypothetical protein